jgi:hypothetical protein
MPQVGTGYYLHVGNQQQQRTGQHQSFANSGYLSGQNSELLFAHYPPSGTHHGCGCGHRQKQLGGAAMDQRGNTLVQQYSNSAQNPLRYNRQQD